MCMIGIFDQTDENIFLCLQLASMVLQRQASQPQDPFANNWLERLRKIRRIKSTLVDEKAQDPESPSSPKTLEDFTQYV